MLAIINATLVMPDYFIPNASILMEDGKIVDFGKKLSIPENAEILDAKGQYVGPGLVDIHTHADGETWFYDDPEKADWSWCNHRFTHAVLQLKPPAVFRCD